MNKYLVKFPVQVAKYILIVTIGVCFFNDDINAAKLNCATNELVILKDGSSICISEILAKNTKDKSNSSKIIEGVKTDSKYAIAVSSSHECKSFGYASTSPYVTNALSDCQKNGCDCEVVIASGISLVTKRGLLGEEEKVELVDSKDLAKKDIKDPVISQPLPENKSKEAAEKSEDKSKPEERQSENSSIAAENHAESDSNDSSKKISSPANHSPLQAALYIPLIIIGLLIIGLGIYWRKIKNNKPKSNNSTEASE